MDNIVFSLENLNFSYGKKVVLQGLNIQLHTGDVVGIIGKNGCGKTTLLKIISGLLHPDSGVLSLKQGMFKRPFVSGILETPKLIDGLTGDENLRYQLSKNF